MERFNVYDGGSMVRHIKDSKPKVSYKKDVCTMFPSSSSISPNEVCNSLNMAHELRQLPPSATKKQMLEIINKYR